ncbi:hypothetical protein ST47_g7105 [Ascochyta rabiei]|uniref:Uncharacterized protein n=1 Tax=Didymella rabiei TaxID=5454 RepID=A0A163BHZ1_DIDRA|nr:hypothetical protein ST47_g7105 [Ascochyta rabiei]
MLQTHRSPLLSSHHMAAVRVRRSEEVERRVTEQWIMQGSLFLGTTCAQQGKVVRMSLCAPGISPCILLRSQGETKSRECPGVSGKMQTSCGGHSNEVEWRRRGQERSSEGGMCFNECGQALSCLLRGLCSVRSSKDICSLATRGGTGPIHCDFEVVHPHAWRAGLETGAAINWQ